MLDPQLIDQILNAWRDDQDHPQRDRIKRIPPPAALLKQFVEAVFYASLIEEEGRSIRFAAVLATEQEVSAEQRYQTEFQVFEKQILFIPSAIGKIAPALDPRLNSLAVAWNEVTQDLRIWGVFAFSHTTNRFSSISVSIEDGSGHRPDMFTASAMGKALVVFSRQDSMLGRMINGHFIRSSPTPLTHFSLGAHLFKMVKKLPLWAGQENLRWLFVRQALEVLISEAESRGHGGTIVLLDAKASIPLALFQPKYVMHGTQWLPLLLKSCAENEMNQSLHWGIEIKYRKSTLDSLQRVAQLAAIDGALVVNSKFEVIAFGATLCAPEWQGKVEIGPDGFGVSVGTLFDLTRYGTRHRSAANFAAACSDSIVFVISQDGPVRAFARADDRLLCWPDCSNSMFV